MIISVRLSLEAFEENIFTACTKTSNSLYFLGAFAVISIHIYINKLCN